MNTRRHLLVAVLIVLASFTILAPARASTTADADWEERSCADIGPRPDKLKPSISGFVHRASTGDVLLAIFSTPECMNEPRDLDVAVGDIALDACLDSGPLMFRLGPGTSVTQFASYGVQPCFVPEVDRGTSIEAKPAAIGTTCATDAMEMIQGTEIQLAILATEDPPACMASDGLLQTAGNHEERVCTTAQLKPMQPCFLYDDQAEDVAQAAGQ